MGKTQKLDPSLKITRSTNSAAAVPLLEVSKASSTDTSM